MMERRYTLVTGASSGIGRGICTFLSKDRTLILHGRDREKLEKSRGECSGEGHLLWITDLRTCETVAASLESLLDADSGVVDSFVHSAGVVDITSSRLVDCQTSLALMNVNFLSAVEIIRVLLSTTHNKKALRNILFISSIYSKLGAKGQGVYCASKGAIDSYVRALAMELSPKVRVNSLLPGAIITPMANISSAEYLERCGKAHPLGLGEVFDVANYVRFILSDDARWLTGQNIVIDGGFSAGKPL